MRRFVWILPALLIGLALSGCTIVGFTFSQTLAEQNQTAASLDGGGLRKLSTGSRVRGELFDGRRFAGRLVGFIQDEAAAYATRYAQWQSESGLAVPGIGEQVQIAGGENAEGYFEGFDFDGVWLRGRAEAVSLREVESVRGLESGSELSGSILRDEASQGTLPYRSRMQLERDGERGSVHTDDVARIAVRRGAAWTYTPIILGMAIDAFAIYSYGQAVDSGLAF